MTHTTLDLETPVYDPVKGTRLSHLAWSRVIARAVRERHRFGPGSQEERDLEQTAAAELSVKLPDFDFGRVPVGGNADMAFRGWVKEFVKSACSREALRLRNGGLYHTTRTPGAAGFGGEVPDGGSAQESARRAATREGICVDVGDVACRLSGTELAVECEPDLDAWAGAVVALDLQRERTLWHLGDLVRYGEAQFGPDAWDKLGALGYATKTLSKACNLSKKYPPEIRISGASWSHHRVACSLPLTRAVALLQRAVRERLSVADLKAVVVRRKARKRGRAAYTRLERERAPAVAERCGLTESQVLGVLRAFRELARAAV